MILTRTAAPPPLSVSACKDHLKVLHYAEDHLVEVYLSAALQELDGPDGIIGKCVAAQTWRLDLPGWQDVVVLPVEPVRAVSVTYDDPSGVSQPLDPVSYILEAGVGLRPRLRWLAPERPPLAAVPWPVRVTIEAGPEHVASDILTAIWLRAADLYENREARIVGASQADNSAWASLIARHRRYL